MTLILKIYEPLFRSMSVQAAALDREANAALEAGDKTAARILRAQAEGIRVGREVYMVAVGELAGSDSLIDQSI